MNLSEYLEFNGELFFRSKLFFHISKKNYTSVDPKYEVSCCVAGDLRERERERELYKNLWDILEKTRYAVIHKVCMEHMDSLCRSFDKIVTRGRSGRMLSLPSAMNARVSILVHKPNLGGTTNLSNSRIRMDGVAVA